MVDDLGPGDGVKITVFQNPDLNLETRVSETGAISYPLVGSVQVGGLSVAAAEVLRASVVATKGSRKFR